MSARFLTAIVALCIAARLPAQSIDFNRDIRPILSGKCSQCHGPDDAVRKAGLRLDVRDSALKELQSGHRAIVPGDAAKSELIARVSSTDPSYAMPPAKVGKRLTGKEVETLRRWIQEGAKYAQHWSYVKPVRPPLPAVTDTGWCRTPVD